MCIIIIEGEINKNKDQGCAPEHEFNVLCGMYVCGIYVTLLPPTLNFMLHKHKPCNVSTSA